MIQLERPDPEQNGRIQKNSLVPLALLSFLICAVLVGAWAFLSPTSPWQLKKKNQHPGEQATVASPVSPSQPAAAIPIKTPAKAASLPEQPITTTGQKQEHPPEKKFAATEHTVDNHEGCRELARRLHAFFILLDNKEYIRQFHLGAPAQQYFLGLAKKLLRNPPVVSRETDDLYTMLKNMAHFFRIIGGRNITIIKTILDRERDTIEDVAADLFQWITGAGCSEPQFSFQAPLDKLYEYAGFFLNSLGGRSYLFRRDSRSRLLVSYYAILVVDHANSARLNKYGIDLRPIIPRTIKEIEDSNQLIYKERYLDTLYGLMEKYPRTTKVSRSSRLHEPQLHNTAAPQQG